MVCHPSEQQGWVFLSGSEVTAGEFGNPYSGEERETHIGFIVGIGSELCDGLRYGISAPW